MNSLSPPRLRTLLILCFVSCLLFAASSSAVCLLDPPFCAHRETKNRPRISLEGVARQISPLQRHSRGKASWETIHLVLALDTNGDGLYGTLEDNRKPGPAVSIEVIDVSIRGHLREETEVRIMGSFSKKRPRIFIAKEITDLETGATFIVDPWKHPLG